MHKRIEVSMPPGVVIRGTDRQSAGRYLDANLVRFYEGATRPIGGWRKRSQTAITGKGRELLTWRDNSGSLWAGIGTESGLYVMTYTGVIHDVTPAGFTAGRADATNGGGYGTGKYGAGIYGLPIVGTNNILPASIWSFDLWGQNLVGVMSEDGIIYEWTPSGTPSAALAVANAPTGTAAVIVTNERILVALGAGNNPRLVKWSDSEDNTQWTPSATNQAGEYEIKTQGRLCCGIALQNGFLAFTDTDVHRFDYIDSQLVYGAQLEGDGSGVISQNAAIMIDGQVIWMGPQGFWSYNGFVQPLPCEIAGEVFVNINRAQISKVSAFHNSSFGEIWWFYPSKNATECDKVAVYSYREGHWTKHDLARLSASDMSPFSYPLMVGDDGFVYEHEVGTNHGEEQPFLVSGPVEIGEGDSVVNIWKYVPDEATLGQVDVSFLSRYNPHGTQTESGPYNAREETDLRISGRQHSLKYLPKPNSDWRIGRPRLEISVAGRR